MKLIALMLVRNEERFLNFTARVAMEWVDGIVFYMHNCIDNTLKIVEQLEKEFPDRITYLENSETSWREMDLRQSMLDQGRLIGGTHFAMIDGDEAVTANVIPKIREYVEGLNTLEALELPMVAPWRSFNNFRDDSSVWSRSWISLAFKDNPILKWKPDASGYQHHSRLPIGIEERKRLLNRGEGGIFHLQWLDWKWLKTKQTWYAMKDLIQYPERGIDRIGKMYGESVNEKDICLTQVPLDWYDYQTTSIDMINKKCEPWHKSECEEMIERYGKEKFEGFRKYGLFI